MMARSVIESLASEFRDQALLAVISAHHRAEAAGLHLEQNDYGVPLVAGLLEVIGIVFSEAFRHDKARLVEAFPRCDDIIRKTAERMWRVGHVPGCSCPNVHD